MADEDEYMLSGRAVRRTAKVVKEYIGRPLNAPGGAAPPRYGSGPIRQAVNATGEELNLYDLVALSTGSLSFAEGGDLQGTAVRATKATTAYTKSYGIVVGYPAQNEEYTLVSLGGGLVNYTGTVPEEGKSVGPVSGSFAVSTTGAPYFTVVGVSTQFSLVDVVPYQPATISPVTLGAQLANSASVTVTLSDGRQVSATNKSGQTLEIGNALCVADPFDGTHYLTGSAAPSTSGERFIWRCTLNDNIAPNATGSIQLSDTTIGTAGLVTATNWSLSHYANLSSRGVAWKDTNGSYYFHPEARRWWMADLNAGLSSTGLTAEIANPIAIDGGSTLGPTTALDNQFGDYGKAGDRVLFLETPNAGSAKYALVRVFNRTPRLYKAVLASGGIASTSVTGTVESIVALDGAPAPSTVSLTVQNPFHWSGAAGNYCHVVEDHSSTTTEYILERVEFVKRQVVVASTWNSTSLIHNYINVPLPYTNETGTTVVFATTQATAVQTVTTTGINLVRFDRPLTVFAAGASTQVTIATGTTC